VIEKICAAWGTPALAPYLGSLVVTDRVSRAGFSAAAVAELFLLSEVHDFLYPPAGRQEAREVQAGELRDVVRAFRESASSKIRRTRESSSASARRARGWGEIATRFELRECLSHGAPNASMRQAPLGEILVSHGVISRGQLEQALQAQQREPGERLKIGRILRRDHGLSADDVNKALCVQRGFLLLDLEAVAPSHGVVSFVTREVAVTAGAVPVLSTGEQLVVAFEDPLLEASRAAADSIAAQSGQSVVTAWAAGAAVQRRLGEMY